MTDQRMVGANYPGRRVASRRNVIRWMDVVFPVFVSRDGSNDHCRRRAARIVDATQTDALSIEHGGISRARVVVLTIIFLCFFVGGVARFVADEPAIWIVPPHTPRPWAAVIVSGGFELIGAAGTLWKPTRRMTGLGLMAVTIAVTPDHCVAQIDHLRGAVVA